MLPPGLPNTKTLGAWVSSRRWLCPADSVPLCLGSLLHPLSSTAPKEEASAGHLVTSSYCCQSCPCWEKAGSGAGRSISNNSTDSPDLSLICSSDHMIPQGPKPNFLLPPEEKGPVPLCLYFLTTQLRLLSFAERWPIYSVLSTPPAFLVSSGRHSICKSLLHIVSPHHTPPLLPPSPVYQEFLFPGDSPKIRKRELWWIHLLWWIT